MRLTLICVSVMAGALSAQAVPLSSRPTQRLGPHYFGYFASAMKGIGGVPSDGCPAENYTACVADHANVTFIGTHSSLGAIDVNDTLAKLEQTKQLGMGAVVVVTNIFFDGDRHPITSWSADWSNFANTVVRPYQDTIIALYLIDEPPIGYPGELQFISQVALQLKTDFPNIHREVTFLASSLDADGWAIPPGVDWVGYDCYTPPPGDFKTCSPGSGSVPYYVGRLKSLVRGSSLGYPVGLVLFPVAWEDHDDHSIEAQAALLKRVEREISLAEHDPDFVMVLAFLWQSNATRDRLGVNEFPIVRRYYNKAGLSFTTGSMRIAYPMTITASSSYQSSLPNRAFDYDGSTMWNAGAYAPAWIAADFGDPFRVEIVNMLTAQTPAGPVQWTMYGAREDGAQYVLSTFSGNMSDNVLSEVLFSPSQSTTRITMLTTSSPSWIAWRDITPWTYGTTRIYAYPIAATGAYTRPELIADADEETGWNSGGYAPQSIDLDLGRETFVHRIRLVVYQTPAGPTTHVIYGGPSPNPTTVIATSSSYTADRDALDFQGSFDVRYLRIATTSSWSWVGWREVNVFE